MLVPDHVRDEIVPILYREALKMRWESLPQADRTRAYNQWAARKDIGGVLAGHLGSPNRVRSWLKDGPLKHLTNARAGAGPYTKYVDASESLPDKITAAVLGQGWEPVDGTHRTKPLRFDASDGHDTVTVVHGPARKFRDLAWSALCTEVDDTNPATTVVVVTETAGEAVPPTERNRQLALADRCRLALSWVELADL